MPPVLYVKWGQSELIGIERLDIFSVLTEIDREGNVAREVGLDSSGQVMYRAPSSEGALRRGLFDVVRVDIESAKSRDLIAQNEFDRLWDLAKLR